MLASKLISRIRFSTRTVLFGASSPNFQPPQNEMSKKASKQSAASAGAKASGAKASNDVQEGPIFLNKNNELCISIFAKPGSKDTAIADIDSEAVNVRVAAPPIDGEANKELVRFIAKFLGLRTSDVSLDKGSKNRNKVLVLSNCSSTIEELKAKFQSESERQ